MEWAKGNKVVDDGVAPEALAVHRLPHLPDLDGVRAVAVGMVFIGHAKLLPQFPAGFGVTLFFFLSGYLITSLMRLEFANTGDLSMRNFYIRRFLRINPPLFITMAFIGGLVMLGTIPQSTPDALGIISQLFFFSNYLPDHGMETGLPSPLWSLAVEEHFYLIFPLCFLVAIRRMTAGQLAVLCAIACGAILAVRLFNVSVLGLVQENYYWTHTRIDSILFGCILALWANPVIENRPAWKASGWHASLALAVIVGTFAFKSAIMREGVRYTLQSGALFVIFNYQLQGKNIASRILRWPIVQKFGLWSYTLYLVHYALLYAVRNTFSGMNSLLTAGIALALSCAYCAIIYALVERPLGEVRRRLTAGG